VVVAAAGRPILSGMLRRNRSERVAAPDPALMRLVETTGAAARGADGLRSAMALVLDDVAVAARWQAGHAWVPYPEPGAWISSGLWFPDDGIGLGGLRRACVDAAPGPVAGHLALALDRCATQWVGDLDALAGSPVQLAAQAARIVGAVACPVFAGGVPVALLEWYVATPARPAADVAHVLGHLSGVLSEVAERGAVPAVPSPRSPSGRLLPV
jgi:hypothetical protein